MTARPPEQADQSAIVRRLAEKHADRDFLTFTETCDCLTYGQFDTLVNRIANSLITLGVKYGDFVNLMLPNGIAYLGVCYALRRIGAIEVAVNCEVRGAALARMLNLSKSRILVVSDEFAEHVNAIAKDLLAPQVIIVVGDSAPFKNLSTQGKLLEYRELAETGYTTDPGISVNPLDPAIVMFTSGTTGPSKGCLLTQRQAIRSGESIVEAVGLTSEDCMYTAYPLFHGRASTLDALASMLVGGRVVLAPRFSASRFWDHAREFNVTTFSIIGTVMQIIWKQPPSPRDKDHKVRVTWGGPITIEPEVFEQRFGVRVLPGEGVYGMTETGIPSMASFDPAASGKIRPMYQVRIGDADDAELPSGEVGEILVRPDEPGVLFSGYLAMPEATLEANRNLWFHTGDLGKMDAEGRLTFVGRKGERIRRGGHNISAWEIEEVIDEHPDVLENAVIGVPSALGEQDVKAYIVTRPGASLTAAQLLEYCQANLAKFMVPQHLEFLDEMPKTQSGKPAKGALLALHKAQMEQR